MAYGLEHTLPVGPIARAILSDKMREQRSSDLYQIPEAVTLVGGYPNQHLSDSTWRTMEVRHAYTASG